MDSRVLLRPQNPAHNVSKTTHTRLNIQQGVFVPNMCLMHVSHHFPSIEFHLQPTELQMSHRISTGYLPRSMPEHGVCCRAAGGPLLYVLQSQNLAAQAPPPTPEEAAQAEAKAEH